ncbi:hypothetical protein AM500_13840 [Bacillus sp. FJAT-18017]|uniref:hypothetical protein n=1 Tax=Bacillus sp. FJAT-18017 TaxID=1705566 RepID=UPI0006AFEF97|nr:hypothetical protein [Bacillus sp. FJAT-18017]ALC90748.1 hypothetical protein AM500_13840 [Bacillus sp. FJAT-18017]
MEYILVFSFHYFIMGSLVMLFSGVISFFFPRITFSIVIILLSILTGYIYSVIYEVPILALFSIIYNGALSLLALGFVKAYLYSKKYSPE